MFTAMGDRSKPTAQADEQKPGIILTCRAEVRRRRVILDLFPGARFSPASMLQHFNESRPQGALFPF
jgi:hypothetical protein